MPTKKPAIVYVLERFPADTLNFVYNEIRGLEKSGFSVNIYSLMAAETCPRESRDFLDRTNVVRPVSLAGLLNAFFYFLGRNPWALVKLFATLPLDNEAGRIRKFFKTIVHLLHGMYFAWLLRGRTDHIHAHFAFKAATAAYAAATLNGATFSFTAHGSATVFPPSRYSLKSKVKNADFVVAVSEFNKRTMEALCPRLSPDRIVVNRTGILLGQFPLLDRASSRPVFTILCVATLYPVKNHAGLIRACGVLHRRELDFQLILIGKDDMGLGAGLKELARQEGIEQKVVFRGSVDHGEIAQEMVAADVCLLTSHSEGIPVSLMEAMASGVPVIGPRVTGVAELVIDGRTGLLVSPDSPEEIADAIQKIRDFPDGAREMAGAARRLIETEYDMESNATRLAGIFSDRLKEQGRI